MINDELKLLPYKAKVFGVILLLLAIVFASLYFTGHRPDYTYTKVFTVFSVYIEKKSFTVIETNILDELAAILFIIGLLLITLSKEPEEQEIYTFLRFKAMYYSILSTSCIWIAIVLLVYGLPVFIASATVFIFFIIIYYLIFRYFVFKSKK